MPGSAAEDLRHADGERHRAAGAGRRRVSPTSLLQIRQGSTVVMPRRGEHCGRRVDGEVVAGVQRRGRDERHDADEPLEQHRAVADRPDVAFLVDHLRRRARRDQRSGTRKSRRRRW